MCETIQCRWLRKMRGFYNYPCAFLVIARFVRTMIQIYGLVRPYLANSICKWLSAKRCASWGMGFWLPIKSVSNTCCFVCVFIIGQTQWKQYKFQIWSCWRNIYFWKWKAPRNSAPENGHAHGECFRCFHVHDESKHYLCHRFVQRRYRFMQCI